MCILLLFLFKAFVDLGYTVASSPALVLSGKCQDKKQVEPSSNKSTKIIDKDCSKIVTKHSKDSVQVLKGAPVLIQEEHRIEQEFITKTFLRVINFIITVAQRVVTSVKKVMPFTIMHLLTIRRHCIVVMFQIVVSGSNHKMGWEITAKQNIWMYWNVWSVI